MPPRSPVPGGDEQAFRIKGTARLHAFIAKPENVCFVFRVGQCLVEILAGSMHTVRVGVFGTDQPIAIATRRKHFDQHHVGQQFRNIERVDVGAPRQKFTSRFATPVIEHLLQPAIGVGLSGQVTTWRSTWNILWLIKEAAGTLCEVIVSVLGRGGKSAVSARRAECPRTWSPARASERWSPGRSVTVEL